MRINRAALVPLLFVLPAAATTPRHIELVSSSPAADTVLTAAPSELVLTFSAELDYERSAVTMRSPAGSSVRLGDREDTTDRRQLKVAIVDPIEAGAYTVSWVAAPLDDHGGRGRFQFEINRP